MNIDGGSLYVYSNKNDKVVKVEDIFANKEDFEMLILFLINKKVIDMDEFEEFKKSFEVLNKLK